jgi:hypothetical protein
MPGRQILSVTGADDLRRLARDLRAAGNQQAINAELRRKLMDVGRDGAREVRTAVLATPSRGQSARRGRRSLRRKIASSVEVKVRNTERPGVIIGENPAKMPPREGSLLAYYEGIGRWRHPTFGEWSRARTRMPDGSVRTGKSRAIAQRGHPTFYRTLDRIGPQMEAAGDQVLNQIANKIERG